MKRLVPTIAVQGEGTLTVSHMSFRVLDQDDEIPLDYDMQSVLTQLRRAVWFYNNANNSQTLPQRATLLASAIVFGWAAFEQVEARAKQVPEWQETFKSLKKALDYRFLIGVMRNHELHGFALPEIPGEYYHGITHLSGTSQVQFYDGKPVKWRKNGRIDTSKPLVLQVGNSGILVFDESKHKVIPLHVAVKAYLDSFLNWARANEFLPSATSTEA